MSLSSRLRTSEWIYLAYFSYVAITAIAFELPAETILKALLVLFGAAGLFVFLSSPPLQVARDWVPVVLILGAYREMDWFSGVDKPRHLEQQWLAWDHRFLYDAGFRNWIEVWGPVWPWVLEFSYLLVYGIGAFSVAAFYLSFRRDRTDRFLTIYLIGTLAAYAVFPYFPSDPPRVVFPGADLPGYMTATRQLNLMLVGGYGIHSSVFPSAHVSSAFSAAWGLIRFLPEYPWAGWTMLVYAVAVSIATVYGRYHYGADAMGGLVVSLIALVVAARLRPDR